MTHRIIVFIVLSFVVAACAPATSSRIGPSMTPKSEDCEIEILKEGEVPDRPYRDVGIVSLKNCPDYATAPCRQWLTREACLLGGDVAYGATDPTRDGRPDQLAGDVTYTVTIGAYVSHVVPEKDDPVLNATPAEPCDDAEDTESVDVDDPAAQMCTE
ncbi:MAG: hypothetical protein JXX29_07880 [Deltaproteobacteria bacterium]|nr:hypothetical protein [Deltaproteobacteria bacterium]MBN2671577.1 hypothetical protein [Deltaproteobacteria bacterium]